MDCLATSEVKRVVARRQVDDHVRFESSHQVHDAWHVLDPSRRRTAKQRLETDKLIERIEWSSTHGCQQAPPLAWQPVNSRPSERAPVFARVRVAL